MTDLPQWAREKAADAMDFIYFDAPAFDIAVQDVARALVEARQDGRREALEEAAKVAENNGEPGMYSNASNAFRCGHEDAAEHIAAAIRNLKETE